ncbi:MAG: flagellar export chaperone FliS [Oscillospiraceae bacterium]|jgi:flagellar protein FliS|nr:flagellar export chaperone FliS [Oscillospiraceae bacterium]
MSSNPQDLYRRQRILTASPVELIVLLYEGLKKDIILAGRAVANNDVPRAHDYFIKAQAIVSELMNCLDMDTSISEELMRLYEFILEELIGANMKKDTSKLPDLVEIVEELRSAWAELAEQQKGGTLAIATNE